MIRAKKKKQRPRVAVLLSTFNGARYLDELWRSVLEQTLQPKLIFVRDDGSSDETRRMLEKYAASDRRVRLVWGQNVGPAQSFLWLINEADDADYFALCDQDDVWLPEKLNRSVSILEAARRDRSEITLYCGRYFVVDNELNHKRLSRRPRRKLGLANALVDNVATGCTIMLTRETKLMIGRGVPDMKKIVMHDWWLYLVVSALGKVIWDNRALVKYRQHDANVVGERRGLELWMRRLKLVTVDRKRRKTESHGLVSQAEELLRCYGPVMSPTRRAIVEAFLELANESRVSRRISRLRSIDVFRQSRVENLVLKALLISGKLQE